MLDFVFGLISFVHMHSITWRGGESFEIERPRLSGWKSFERRWTRRVGALKNWTFFMDVICVSSLNMFLLLKSKHTIKSALVQIKKKRGKLTSLSILSEKPNINKTKLNQNKTSLVKRVSFRIT